MLRYRHILLTTFLLTGLNFSTSLAQDATAEATASPIKAGQIVFTSDRDSKEKGYKGLGLYLMDVDGSNQHQINYEFGGDYMPAFSPDGTQIAFTSIRDGLNEIYSVNIDGSNLRNLSNNPAYDSYPAWSPDGSQIAFSSSRNGSNELYLMNADGSNQHQITDNNSGETDAYATWSPDGKQIAFSAAHGYIITKNAICVVNVDGSNFHCLTDGSSSDYVPRWSPDGSRIVFVSSRDGNFEIYVMNADGSNPQNITNNPRNTAYPAYATWSPNSMQIIFSALTNATSSDPNYDIYVMNADGSDVRNLTNNPAYEIEADWGIMPKTKP